MWLYLIAGALVLLGVFGGIFAGGVFTIVLIPIALIVLASSIFFRGAGEAAKQNAPSEPMEPALPHGGAGPNVTSTGTVPTSPEQLVRERQASQ